MDLKDIVIDYEYAIKLKELGVEQKSYFYFLQNKLITDVVKDEITEIAQLSNCIPNCISAFTSDELLGMLPVNLEADEVVSYLIIDRHNIFSVFYSFSDSEPYDFKLNEIINLKLSNALAKMLIWLIENKYVKVG